MLLNFPLVIVGGHKIRLSFKNKDKDIGKGTGKIDGSSTIILKRVQSNLESGTEVKKRQR